MSNLKESWICWRNFVEILEYYCIKNEKFNRIFIFYWLARIIFTRLNIFLNLSIFSLSLNLYFSTFPGASGFWCMLNQWSRDIKPTTSGFSLVFISCIIFFFHNRLNCFEIHLKRYLSVFTRTKWRLLVRIRSRSSWKSWLQVNIFEFSASLRELGSHSLSSHQLRVLCYDLWWLSLQSIPFGCLIKRFRLSCE